MNLSLRKREGRTLAAGAFAYAALYAFLSQIDECGQCSLPEAALRFLPAFPVALAALLLLFRLLPEGLRRRRRAKGSAGCASKRFSVLAAFALILLSFVPNWLIFYPGSFTYDTQRQVIEVAGGTYSTLHPLLHTLMIRFCISCLDWVGSLEKTAALYAVLQMTLLAACFAEVSASIARMRTRRAGRLSVCFFVLYPTHAVMASNCTKDVLFGGFFALFLALCLEQTAGGTLARGRRVEMIASGTLACLLRPNVIYAVMVWAALLWLAGKEARRLFGTALMVLALSLGANAGLKAATHASPGSIAEMLSVPAQQLARALVMSPESFTQDDRDLAEQLFVKQSYAYYTPSISDPVKNRLNTALIKGEPLRVAKLWLDVGLRCPGVYLDAYLNLALPSLYPYRTYRVAAPYIEVGQHSGVWTIPFGQPDMVSPARFEGIRNGLAEHVWNTGADHVPLLRLIFNTGAVFWICGACVLYAVYAGQRRRLRVLALPVLLYVGYLFGPVMQGRYLYPIVCLLPMLLLTAEDEAPLSPPD